MGRNPCCTKVGLNKGTWTALEDKTLADYIHLHGEGKWKLLPKNAGLKRCGKSCRLRWLNYLRPDIKRGNISEDEEELIVRLHKLLGNRWSLIARRIPGRTDNEIKNYWNTNLSKKAALSPKSQMTKANSNNAINKMAVSPNSSVFRTRASRCSKVVVIQPPAAAAGVTNIISYEAFGSSDSNIVRNGWTDDVGLSCNNDQPAEGIMTGLAILMDDDLGLGDFFLSDFLNTDHHGQSIDNTHNENDLDFSGLLNWALDVDEEQMKQSMNIGGTGTGTGTDEDQNRQQFSGFVDSYDNWDI